MRRTTGILLMTCAVTWCWGVNALRAADEGRSSDGLSSPVTEMPQRYEAASVEEGPLVGVWRALTGTRSEPLPPAGPAPEKTARPEPLSLREYLNASRQPALNDAVTTTSDLPLTGDEQAPSAGTWVQYGF